MLAIPSPDLLVNLFASVAQLLGLLALCLGGGLVQRRAVPGAAPRTTRRWPLLVAGTAAIGFGTALLFYHLSVVDAEQRRLRTNLVRSSQEAGKGVGDTSLKTLAFSAQLDHPRGVSTAALQERIASGAPLNLIDVRETEEVEMGGIPGTWARRYPDLMADRSNLLVPGKETILLCESGNRSSELADAFGKEGILVGFMIGGYEKWVAEDRPIEGLQRGERDDLRALPAFRNKDVLLTTDEVQQMYATEDILFVDVRYPKDFEQGHLPGAVNVPLRKLRLHEAAAAIAALPRRPIVVPCYDKRSSFYALILGCRLDRAGREFRGRYTVPHEFALPQKESEWVAKWHSEVGERTWLGDVVATLAGLLTWLAPRLGSLVLAILAAALGLRLLLLPWSLRADRDQLRLRALAPTLAALRERLAGDPTRLRRAILALLQRERIRPGRNLLVTIVQLLAFTALFAAVNVATTGSTATLGWLRLDQPDPYGALTVAVVALMAGIVWLQGIRSRAGAVFAIGFLVAVGGLVAFCGAGAQIYLVASLGVMLLQSFAVRWWLRPRAPSTASGLVPLTAAAGRSDLGGKARRLGEMIAAGLPVPDGFVVSHGHRLSAADHRTIAARGNRFAVRSSAEGEDGSVHSMAGAFRTILDVAPDGLDAAIAAVRKSYGERRGGVVIQPMVPAGHAGVLFTEDPAHAGRMLVELVEGLGEALVSGSATPIEYRCNRVTLATIGPRAPLDLEPLLQLGRQLERHFGRPQDIEWAAADGRFWLLQSRDITHRAADDQGPVGVREAERARLLAVFAGATPTEIVAEAGDFAALLPAPTPQSLALMQDVWGPGGSVDLACRRLGLGYGGTEESPPYVQSVFGRCLIDRRQARQRIRFGAAAAFRLGSASNALEQSFTRSWLPRAREAARLHAAIAPERLILADLLQLFATTRQRFLHESYVEAEVINLAAETYVGEARRRLERAGVDPAAVLGRGVSTVVQRAFALLQAPGQPLADRQASFVAAFGHRALHDFELAEPRYGEAPTVVQALAQGAQSPARSTPATAPDLPGGRLCRLAVARARRFQELKEEAKDLAAHDLALLRRLLVAIGSRTGLGDDVFFLLPDEVPTLAEPSAVAGMATLAARRRRDLTWLGAVPLADVVQLQDLVHLGEERPIAALGSGLLRGTRVAGDREVVGRVVVLHEPASLVGLTTEDILVTRCTDPAWLPAFGTVAGLVTEVGGWLSHGAIQAREQNLAAIVGAVGATQRLRTGMVVKLERSGVITIVDATSEAERQSALAAAK